MTGKNRSQIIFQKIYQLKNWGSGESVSGPGSNLRNTESLRRELPVIISELKIKTLLDIPCGDFYWMKEINLPVQKYIGADIVEELVNKNNLLFSDEKRSFMLLDISRDNLPENDAVFCRDCLPHFSFKLIKSSLKKIKSSGSKYLFTSTYISCGKNKDATVGSFRPLNLQLKPFSFPEPIRIINDPCITEKINLKDKCIGIWSVKDIPL